MKSPMEHQEYVRERTEMIRRKEEKKEKEKKWKYHSFSARKAIGANTGSSKYHFLNGFLSDEHM